MRARAALGIAIALLPAGCGGHGGAGPEAPLAAPTCSTGPVVSGTPALGLTAVVGGLDRPVDLQAAPGDGRRMFVVEQDGRIRVVRDGALLPAPFLDITDRVDASSEEDGLLGLAFHPGYATNGRFFVTYNDRDGAVRLSEFAKGGDPDTANPGSERPLYVAEKRTPRHNGGGLVFGPDGTLFVGVGDGGSTGDSDGNGQSRDTLFGKLLRLDVDHGRPYAIPAGNPFANDRNARPEIFAYGLRNPWRFAFSREGGDLLIADVGNSRWEEVDLLPRGKSGLDYGWNLMEGTHCFQPPGDPNRKCSPSGLTLPILEYGHDEGCAITGGAVYDGCRMPGYHGAYFYSDYCSGFLRSLRVQDGQAVDRREHVAPHTALSFVTSFGTDAEGEMYVLTQGGTIYRVAPTGP